MNLKFSRGLRVIQSLPVIISMIGILVLPITYVHGETTDYSLGPKAYALYGSLVIYLLLILYYCIRYWSILDSDKRLAIVLAVPLFVITALIQMAIPETLVVIVCSTLILLGLILSNENTEKYIDEKTTLFNQYSFEKVLEEFDFDRQKPIAAILCFCRTENSLDWRQDALILNDIHREIKQYHLYGYRVGENGVVFLGNSKEKAELLSEKIKNNMEDRYGAGIVSIETKVLAGDAVNTKYDCMRNIIAFCTEAVEESGTAYRQGGDEFAVLYTKDAECFLQDLEQRCKDYNQSSALPISYAIGYCLLEKENFRDVADQMMYEDKRNKKQRSEFIV